MYIKGQIIAKGINHNNQENQIEWVDFQILLINDIACISNQKLPNIWIILIALNHDTKRVLF